MKNLGLKFIMLVLVYCRDCVIENDWCWCNFEYFFCRVIYLNVFVCVLGDIIKIFVGFLKVIFWFWFVL